MKYRDLGMMQSPFNDGKDGISVDGKGSNLGDGVMFGRLLKKLDSKLPLLKEQGEDRVIKNPSLKVDLKNRKKEFRIVRALGPRTIYKKKGKKEYFVTSFGNGEIRDQEGRLPYTLNHHKDVNKGDLHSRMEKANASAKSVSLPEHRELELISKGGTVRGGGKLTPELTGVVRGKEKNIDDAIENARKSYTKKRIAVGAGLGSVGGAALGAAGQRVIFNKRYKELQELNRMTKRTPTQEARKKQLERLTKKSAILGTALGALSGGVGGGLLGNRHAKKNW